MAYPPGVFAVFLPSALIGRYCPLSTHAYGVLNILYLLFLAHLSFFAVLVSLKTLAPGARGLVAMLTWLLMVSMAMEGFYDPLLIGAGALGLRALARGSPTSALLWLCGAALLHFRAAPLAPWGCVAVWQIVQGKSWREWPWRTFSIAALALTLVVGSFVLLYPATEGFRLSHSLVLSGKESLQAFVIVSSLLAFAAAFFWADWLVAISVLLSFALVWIERQPYWWHQAMLLIPLLAVGAFQLQPRRAALARMVLSMWLISLGVVVWSDGPNKLDDQPVMFFWHFYKRFSVAP